ncbi:MAG TPA: TonB-dependent receptor [Solimonas sp.]
MLNRTASQHSEVDSADSLNAAYTLLDARLGYESDHWSLVAYGRNLLDEFYTTDRFAMPADAGRSEAGIARSYGDGRSYGLQVELRF